MTLGELIARLKEQPQDNYVCFDFCEMLPTSFDSYRGCYEQLALGYKERDNTSVKVSELLARALASNGETFDGYKGGKYTMDLGTCVWVSNYGHSQGTRIVGVADVGCKQTIILTAYEP